MRYRRLLKSMVVLLFLLLAMLVILNKKPLCIDSKVINKVTRISREGEVSIFQCTIARPVAFDEKLSQTSLLIKNSLSDLERFFDDVKPLSAAVELIRVEGSRPTLRVQDNKIIMSEELLAKNHLLEASLIRIWLRENSKIFLIDRTLLESTLVDLILYSLGKFDSSELSSVRWPTNLKSAMAACQSKELPLDIAPLCLDNNFGADSIFLGSARKLISSVLIEGFSKLNLQQSHDIIRSIPDLLSFLPNIMEANIFSAEETLLTQLSAVENEVHKVLFFLVKSLEKVGQQKNNPSFEKLKSYLLEQLKLHGWNASPNLISNSGALFFDHLFYLAEESFVSNNFLNRVQQNQYGFEFNGVLVKNQLWFPKSKTWIPLSSISSLSAHNILFVSNRIPDQSLIASLVAHSDRVLLVKSIAQGTQAANADDLVIRGYLRSGYCEFAKENPGVSFLQIHSPSLLQALKIKTLDRSKFEIPLNALTDRKWNHPFFLSLGWQDPKWNEKYNFYESKSIIQAIQAYRL